MTKAWSGTPQTLSANKKHVENIDLQTGLVAFLLVISSRKSPWACHQNIISEMGHYLRNQAPLNDDVGIL